MHTHTHTHTHTLTHSHTHTHTHIHTHIHTHRHTQMDTHRRTHTDGHMCIPHSRPLLFSAVEKLASATDSHTCFSICHEYKGPALLFKPQVAFICLLPRQPGRGVNLSLRVLIFLALC